MKRVELGPVTLYLGDAAEIVPTLSETVDLIATDPPWGVNFQSGYRTSIPKYDVIHGDRGEVDVPAILSACVKKLRKKRHVYVFGPRDLVASVDALTPPTELIWDKERTGMGDLSLPWAPAHEQIHFSVKVQSAAERKEGRGNATARLRQASVLRGFVRPDGNASVHPNEKPVPLMRRIVEASSNLGDLVLDPFMGSASTVVAALVSGRRAIGIEIDEKYFAAAVERVQRILPTVQLLESA